MEWDCGSEGCGHNGIVVRKVAGTPCFRILDVGVRRGNHAKSRSTRALIEEEGPVMVRVNLSMMWC